MILAERNDGGHYAALEDPEGITGELVFLMVLVLEGVLTANFVPQRMCESSHRNFGRRVFEEVLLKTLGEDRQQCKQQKLGMKEPYFMRHNLAKLV